MTATRVTFFIVAALFCVSISCNGQDNNNSGRGNRGDRHMRFPNNGEATFNSQNMRFSRNSQDQQQDGRQQQGGDRMRRGGPGGGFPGGPGMMPGGPRMSPEQMEAFRNMTPEQRMESFRKMRDQWREQQKPKATPEPGSEIALTKAYAQPEQDIDLSGSGAMSWRRLTEDQRIEIATWSQEERQSFRKSLREFVLSPDKVSSTVVEQMENFLTPGQVAAIRKLTAEQLLEANRMIDGYTTAVLVTREYTKLPESDREALKKLPPSEKLKYLQDHGLDTALFRSAFAVESNEPVSTPTVAAVHPPTDVMTTAAPEVQPNK